MPSVTDDINRSFIFAGLGKSLPWMASGAAWENNQKQHVWNKPPFTVQGISHLQGSVTSLRTLWKQIVSHQPLSPINHVRTHKICENLISQWKNSTLKPSFCLVNAKHGCPCLEFRWGNVLVVLSYILLFLNWLVIATSIYLLSLISHALLWGFAVGMTVMVGFYALGQAFSPPVRQGWAD
jgi:hypothetical protein